VQLTSGSFWLDMNTHGKKIQFGLFAGYTKNPGTSKSIRTDTYYKKKFTMQGALVLIMFTG
jgi:hypothetical protein